MNENSFTEEIKNENIRKFLEKVAEDKELQGKFSKLRDPDEAYKLAASVQDGFTKEEFTAEMKRLYAEAVKDLSEDDIATLAGGTSVGETVAASVICSLSWGGAAALAASSI